MSDPRASDTVVAEALVRLGWNQPVSSIPVSPLVVPVVILGGGDVGKRATAYSGLMTGVANQHVTASALTVPSGKQWQVIYVTAVTDAAADYITMLPRNAPATKPIRISATVIPTDAAFLAGGIYDFSGGGLGLQLGPGDSIGFYDTAGGDTVYMTVSYIETNA